jgi:hypothetical protein
MIAGARATTITSWTDAPGSHASHRGNSEEAGRGRDRLHRRRRVLDGPQPRPLHRAFHRHRGTSRSTGRATDHPSLTRERDEFPDFYADMDRAGTLFLVPGEKPMPPVTVRVVACGPVKSKGPEAVNRQLDTFKAAIERSGASVEEAFVPVLAPGGLDHFIFNEYYKTEEEFLFALADGSWMIPRCATDRAALDLVGRPRVRWAAAEFGADRVESRLLPDGAGPDQGGWRESGMRTAVSEARFGSAVRGRG